MALTKSLRKLILTVHVASSLGWLGAVLVFFILTVRAYQSVELAPSIYMTANIIAQMVILPLSVFSLLSGIIISTGTHWGVFKHYWVLIKFIITVLSVLIFLIHLTPIFEMSELASSGKFSPVLHHSRQLQLIVSSGLALFALFITTVLSVYKPKGELKK